MYSRSMDMPRSMAAPIRAIFITITFDPKRTFQSVMQSKPHRALPVFLRLIQSGRKRFELPDTDALTL